MFEVRSYCSVAFRKSAQNLEKKLSYFNIIRCCSIFFCGYMGGGCTFGFVLLGKTQLVCLKIETRVCTLFISKLPGFALVKMNEALSCVLS